MMLPMMQALFPFILPIPILTLFLFGLSSATLLSETLPALEQSSIVLIIDQDQDIDFKDETGLTPLMQATQDRSIARLQSLIQNGANPNLQDSFGWTALTYAVIGDDSSIVAFLLEHGANPNMKDYKGITILMWASLSGKPETIQSLIAKGVEMNETTKSGGTALSFAEAKGNKKAAKVLKQAGATGPKIHKEEAPKWLMPIDEPPKILNLPMPSYTKEAQEHKVKGIVHLRVLFNAEGNIRQMKMTSGLPYGLTAMAMQAAAKLKAKPAKNNGQPIDYWVHIEVEFNLGNQIR